MLMNEREEAETVFERGARRNPESPTLFTAIGLLAFEVRYLSLNFKTNCHLFSSSREHITQKHLNVLVLL
jgi:hypothetical protein